MPVAMPPDEPLGNEPNVRISESAYKSQQVIDTRKTSLNTLATYVQGQKWPVDYYKQILGTDSANASYQDGLPSVFGQYHLIRNVQLIVSDQLTNRQNTNDINQFETSGAGLIYNCIEPQDGDMFVTDIGNGMNAIFQVNETNLGGYYPEAVTSASWAVIKKVSGKFLDDLNTHRVVRRSFFSIENLRGGLKPILSEDDVNVIKRLANARSRLIYLYFKDFFDDAKETFVLPWQHPGLTYDPYLVRFMKSILETRDHPQVSAVTAHGVSADVYSNQVTLFDAFAQRDPGLLYSASRLMGVSPISNFRQRPLFAGIAYSGIKQVITAIDAAFSVNNTKVNHATLSMMKAGVRQDDIRSLLPQLELEGSEPRGEEASWIKRVLVDEFYVLSEDFYQGNIAKMSILERLLHERLNDRPIRLDELADLADYAHKFDNLERFYYTPLILVLIKLADGVL